MNYKQLADCLLDYMCETDSIRETIQLLVSFGYDKDDLLLLNFDENDIDAVIENTKEVHKNA